MVYDRQTVIRLVIMVFAIFDYYINMLQDDVLRDMLTFFHILPLSIL